MKEVWKDILHFEGSYQVSNHGRVRSLDRAIVYKDGRVYSYKGKYLSLKNKNNAGYVFVTLSKNRNTKNKEVHRLVAETFLHKKQDDLVVNHMDGNKQNNRIENLEWVTRSENTNHALDTGLSPSGSSCSWSGLSDEDVLSIYEKAHSKVPQKEIAEQYGTSVPNVSKIKLGTICKRITGHKFKPTGRGKGSRYDS